jgi:hypothetical protein
MPQMTIFECQKDKNMTRVKNEVMNVNVVLEFISDIANTARNFHSATVHHFRRTRSINMQMAPQRNKFSICSQTAN